MHTELNDQTTELPEPTGLQQIEWLSRNLLVGISANNGSSESTDEGRSWTLRSKPPDGQVEAVDVSGDSWHPATEQGSYTSPRPRHHLAPALVTAGTTPRE